MKNSSKKALEKRGIVSAGRAAATPGARAHDDKRRANRKTDKQRVKREVQLETARNRGPFPFVGPHLIAVVLNLRRRGARKSGKIEAEKSQ